MTPSRACGWQPGAGIFGSESPRPSVGACEKSHFGSHLKEHTSLLVLLPGRIFLLGDRCTVPTDGSVITTKGIAQRSRNGCRGPLAIAIAIDIATRYRKKPRPD